MEVNGLTASETRDEFLQLLVTQLRNQDPLDPVKQEDFLAQLAQFSTLESMENLNQSFDQQLAIQRDVLQLQYLSQAVDLVGREVTYRDVASDAESGQRRGAVDSVSLDNDRLTLHIGDAAVQLEQVLEVHPANVQPTASETFIPGLRQLIPTLDSKNRSTIETIRADLRVALNSKRFGGS